MAIYALVYLIWFQLLEKKVTNNYHVIHTTIDDFIPFIEVFVIPYFFWFAYICIAVVYFLFTSTEDYRKLCWFLAIGMTLFLVVSTIWPNGHHLRPYTMPRDNMFTRMIVNLYHTDTPTNVWPSIHVYNSMAVYFAVICSKRFKEKRGVRIGSFCISLSIVLATMFIKQHSVFDVIIALAMSFIMYIFVYRFTPFLRNRQKREKE